MQQHAVIDMLTAAAVVTLVHMYCMVYMKAEMNFLSVRLSSEMPFLL